MIFIGTKMASEFLGCVFSFNKIVKKLTQLQFKFNSFNIIYKLNVLLKNFTTKL